MSVLYSRMLNCFTRGKHIRVKTKEDFGCTGTFLDVGCGWETSHLSIPDAVGVDINIPIGKVNVEHPIVGDAQLIPVRSGSISFVNCQALLEHIPRPGECLLGMSSVLMKGGKGFILIPVDADWPRNMFKRFFKEFPCSILSTMLLLYRIRKYWKIPGMAHIRQVSLDDIKRYFVITKVKIVKKQHWYNYGNPFPLRGFLYPLLKGRIVVDEFAEYHIWVKKK